MDVAVAEERVAELLHLGDTEQAAQGELQSSLETRVVGSAVHLVDKGTVWYDGLPVVPVVPSGFEVGLEWRKIGVKDIRLCYLLRFLLYRWRT